MRQEDYEEAPRFEKIPHHTRARTDTKHRRENDLKRARDRKAKWAAKGGRP